MRNRILAASRFHRSLIPALASLFLLSPPGLSAELPERGHGVEESAVWQTKVDPWILDTAERFGTTDFLAFFHHQADLSAAAGLATREEKGRFVYEKLTLAADRTQSALLELLSERGIEHRSFWIANMLWVRGGKDIVEVMARRPEVSRLFASPRVPLEQPGDNGRFTSASATTIETSIDHTGAPPEFWANGFAGQGVVIGGQDTGYEWSHPALRSAYRGWNGSSIDHDYNWHDAIHAGGGSCGADSPEPCDDSGHGTHTMGTMIGDDGGANQIGLAPQARWIGCRNMDRGVGTPATYSECFQWFIAPTDVVGRNADPAQAPDVINNSWTCPPSEGCTDPGALRAVVENTRAAGILVVASAGNSGPGCSTVDSPIALYDAVLTVGATDLDDRIASFSSRGPITADGSNRPKPDIAAPGVAIRSSVPGGAYDLSSGTSMAGPHVAGIAALVLSAAECNRGRPRKLESHLLDSTLPRPAANLCGEEAVSAVPNNTYGYGVLRAVLPTCPGDGRIAGATSRLATDTVVCSNRTSGGRTSIAAAGVNAWNCMANGLTASTGDRVVLKLSGAAREYRQLAGGVDGLETIRAVCKNKTTGKRARLRLAGERTWNCERAGLAVDAGDRLKVTIRGRAMADS